MMPRFSSARFLLALTLGILVAQTPSWVQEPVKAPQRPQLKPSQKPEPAKPETDETLTAAQAALEAKEYIQAVELLESYLARHPDHLGARFNLAYSYSLLGRLAEAITAYRKTLELDPKLFQAYLNLGLLLLQEGAPAEAVKALVQAVELRPEHVPARLAYAEALAGSGAKKEACAQYQEVMMREPQNAEALRGLGRLELEAGEYAAAETHLRQTLALAPNRAELHWWLAEALIGQDKLEAAVTELEAYVVAQPQDAAAHQHLGNLYHDLKRNHEALQHFDAALAAGANLPELTAARARTLAELERWEEAAAAFDTLTEAEPQNAQWQFELGLVRLRQGQLEAAVPAFDHAIRLRTDFVEAYNSLALALQLGGDCSATLRVLDLRARYAQETAGSYFLRAICHDRLRQLKAAVENYEKFLAANDDPDSPRAFQARQRLRLLKQQLKRR